MQIVVAPVSDVDIGKVKTFPTKNKMRLIFVRSESMKKKFTQKMSTVHLDKNFSNSRSSTREATKA